LIEDYLAKGIQYCISTDVAKDGMLEGPSFDLYKEMKDRFPTLKTIASGGVSCIEDLENLEKEGIYGVIVGKAIYEGKIQLADLRRFEG
jgi:phosphoribosylformimino-5-aminoimidazole carboxamide ribotide isomerase